MFDVFFFVFFVRVLERSFLVELVCTEEVRYHCLGGSLFWDQSLGQSTLPYHSSPTIVVVMGVSLLALSAVWCELFSRSLQMLLRLACCRYKVMNIEILYMDIWAGKLGKYCFLLPYTFGFGKWWLQKRWYSTYFFWEIIFLFSRKGWGIVSEVRTSHALKP